ncbi:hypothetical protein ACJ8J6_19330 [Serratia sp. CY47279]|uniref:hypothetical protein n=1 Tax=Serratia TaxID=613 RepID=UPI0013DC061B|nr:hypothetical protein [Serratia marcescens]CAI1913123.1 Uncharacterised protein [Serratia marcescens]
MKSQTKKDIKEFAKSQIGNTLVLFLILVLVFFSYKKIVFNDIKDIIGTLQNISAAIFTIVGLWVGFLYPNAIAGIVNDNVDYIKNTKDAPRIEKLIYVIIISALVMMTTLIFYITKAFLGQTELYQCYKNIIKFIALTIITYMSWMQIKCILSVILSNINFANNLHARINKAKIEHEDN